MTDQIKYLINNYFKDKKSGFFIDIGANDGINGSNSYYLECIGWNGICIEPIPQIYNILKQNRNCKCLNIAITEENKEYEFLYVKSIRKQNIYLDMLSGVLEYYDNRHLERIDNELKIHSGEKINLKVQGKTFSTLIEENKEELNILNIDYISIDTEGNELSIIKSIDFNRYNIFSLSIENNYNNSEIISYMKLKGYEHVIDIGSDNIFIKK